MDPHQSRWYATAQRELHELFREISSQGQVGPTELQTALLPFTAGDVRNDVLELIDELQRRHKSSLDEQEFVHVMWKKMYIGHLTLRSKCRPSSASSTRRTESASASAAAALDDVNIPLAHVIVSIKRRSQLRQFADYYASRGISGADHLTVDAAPDVDSSSNSPHSSPRRIQSSPQRRIQRRRVCFDRSVAVPVVTLRAHTSTSYRVLTCVFDPRTRSVATRSLLPHAVRNAQVATCSRLFCLLFAKDAGSYVVGSADVAQQVHREYLASIGAELSLPSSAVAAAKSSLPLPLSVRDDMLVFTRLDDLGLRNVVTAASSERSFVASTERKIHHWTTEPSSTSTTSTAGDLDDTSSSSSSCQFELKSVVLDLDDEGDCFGVLGATKLLARTKHIADVPNVQQLAAGQQFVAALTANADLFVWGDSVVGGFAAAPTRRSLSSQTGRVVRIACGRHHVLVATTAGRAYTWGSNLFGQLGIGATSATADEGGVVAEPVVVCVSHSRTLERTAPAPTPTPDSDHAVLDIACGDDHSLLLLGSGRVVACGSNAQGQLGMDPDSSPDGCVLEPTDVRLPAQGGVNASDPPRAYLIAAIGTTSAAVTTSGDVFQWGLCVPSGAESVCGVVSRWQPQLLAVDERACMSDDDNDEALLSQKQQQQLCGNKPRLLWHSIAIAHGLVVLTRHTEPLLA